MSNKKGIWTPISILKLKLDGVKLNLFEKALLAEIGNLTQNGEPCRASNKYFMDLFEVSKSTVSKYISLLHEKGLIRLSYIDNYKREMSIREDRIPDYKKTDHSKSSTSTTDDKIPGTSDGNLYVAHVDDSAAIEQMDSHQNDMRSYQNDKGKEELESPQIDARDTEPQDGGTASQEGDTEMRNHKKTLKELNKNLKNTFFLLEKNKNPKGSIDFLESPIGTLDAFCEAFENTDYASADLPFYFERIRLWAAAGNRRADWMAIAQTFMLNDYRDGKLKLNKKNKSHESKIINLEQAKRVARNSSRGAKGYSLYYSPKPPKTNT